VGLTQGELKPYASYYLTGFLHEKPLAVLRRDMQRLGIARAAHSAEPEDHAASIFAVMHGLITGAFGDPAELPAQKAFFDVHLDPWMPEFFRDLEAAKHANFYRPVGTLGRAFLAIEKEAFSLVG
jgi:TorA maturation chaperone TorD